MTPEGTTKNKIKKVLKAHDAYYHMPIMNGLGAPTLDFVGCHRGKFYAIEAKALGKKPTDRQWSIIINMRTAGGKVFVIDGDTTELEEWLNGYS